MRSVLLVVSGALVAGGCMMAPAHHGTVEMSDALSSAESETTRHARICVDAGSLNDVMGELQKHDLAMGRILDRASKAMGAMRGMGCTGAGMDSMTRILSSMRAALRDHNAWLSGAFDVAHAHKECDRYRSEMLRLCTSAEHDNDAMNCG